MKLYLITRTDETDWDETNALVVRAENKVHARMLALAHTGQWTWPDHPGLSADNIEVTRLTGDGPEGVVIEDFKAA